MIVSRWCSRLVPIAFLSLLTLTGCGSSGSGSNGGSSGNGGGGGGGGGTPPATLSLSVSPATFTIPDGTSATVTVTAQVSGTAATPTVTLGQLPPGLTSTTTFPLAVTSSGAQITFVAGAALPASTYTISLNGTAGTASATTSLTVTASVPFTNRTDYLSTEGTPNSAVYDPVHGLIFSSNPSWNRVDVISDATHKIVKSVPVMAPQGIDITRDDSTVWVCTASQLVYSIDTTSYAATRHLLPNFSFYQDPTVSVWRAQQIFALADGTFFLNAYPGTAASTAEYAVLWNPATNTLTQLNPPTGQSGGLWEILMRTGNAERVYSIAYDSGGASFWYDVPSKSVSSAVKLGGYAYAAAVNFDGSKAAVFDANGLNMYDGNLEMIGPLPGGGLLSPPLYGGLFFSPDNTTLYEESMPTDIPVIYTINTQTRGVQGVAPAMPFTPASVSSMGPPFYIPVPFAIDATGILLGVQYWGIAFEDSTDFQTYSAGEPGTPNYMQHMSPYEGPLGGGTVSSGFGNGVTAAPSVWYGANLGFASDDNGNLSITSPPASAPGPVNVKLFLGGGVEVFDPKFFTYGTDPEYAVLSGASPDGNVPGQIDGLGLPIDPAGGSVSVGGNTATITSQQGQYLPYTGDPFPSTVLRFTVPAGMPGWADIALSTPNGSGVLPKALFYAQSVKDYSTSDQPMAILYDAQRQQLYLSAQDHIDVFSLSTDQFVAPLVPPAQGTQKQFTGLALTPDGSLLLASDLSDGSLAVINPDNPASSFAIPVAAATTNSNGCLIGPLYVAAISDQQAYVVTGALPAGIGVVANCGPGAVVYQANLSSQTASLIPADGCGGGNVAASHDGAIVAFGGDPQGYGGFCTYNVAQNAYSVSGDYRVNASISGDGNVVSGQWTFFDPNANIAGAVALPMVEYPGYGPNVNGALVPGNGILPTQQLNDSGSLYFMPNPGFVDIIDVQHGLLRMRFSLNETVANVVSPMAIDSGGRYLFLITNQGLTVVDLGEALLSIGHLTPNPAASGTQISIRGSGFTAGLTAKVGGQAASVSFVDQNTLTLTVPALSAGTYDIELTNSGEPSYTLENGITVQ